MGLTSIQVPTSNSREIQTHYSRASAVRSVLVLSVISFFSVFFLLYLNVRDRSVDRHQILTHSTVALAVPISNIASTVV